MTLVNDPVIKIITFSTYIVSVSRECEGVCNTVLHVGGWRRRLVRYMLCLRGPVTVDTMVDVYIIQI